MKKFCTLLLLLCSATICGQTLQLPAIPDSLQTPEGRASYLVEHYWDLYPFGESTRKAELGVEQALVNYIDLFRLVPRDEADASLRATMQYAAREKRTLFHFYNLFEKYLYDLSSPVRDERFFIPVLEVFLDSPLLDDGDKVRPAYLLSSIKKNMVGSVAGDFSITFRDGSTQNLLSLPARTTILYFYDPDCDDCSRLTAELSADEEINGAIGSGSIQVVAVYIGEDSVYWKENSSHIPAAWLCGYDDKLSILDDELYVIPGFPTLYLLDKDKVVLQKETTLEAIKQELQP